jgi:hypothetical protein
MATTTVCPVAWIQIGSAQADAAARALIIQAGSGVTLTTTTTAGVATTTIAASGGGGGGGTPTGAASGDLAGTYPAPTVTQARGLRETAGPTTLTMGAVADGQVLQRSGSTIVGAFLALALVVSQEGSYVALDGLAVVYPSIISSGGTVV